MSTIDTFHRGATAAGGLQAPAFTYRALAAVETFLGQVATFVEKSRTRRALRNLSDHQLRDIGITRYEANLEARRPFWY